MGNLLGFQFDGFGVDFGGGRHLSSIRTPPPTSPHADGKKAFHPHIPPPHPSFSPSPRPPSPRFPSFTWECSYPAKLHFA